MDSDDDVAASSAGTTTPEAESDEVIEVLKIRDEEAEEEAPPAPKRDTWASQLAYTLTLVGYAVGFGNIWRFPYQVRENGGAVFLIPYCVMLVLVGMPIFFMELAVGQRQRKGSIYAWNALSPGFGGLGICHGCLCFLIGFYYNTLLAYCMSYLVDSFRSPLPWTNCTTVGDKEDQNECNEYLSSKASKYYWYRGTLDVSTGIDDVGGYSPLLLLYHLIAWGMVWLILWKGTKLIGKVVYFTAVFPYVVLVIFFVANLAIEPKKGWYGAYRLLTPDWSYLFKPVTWLKAGSQIFFSLGLGQSSIVVFASYSPARNNCYKDSIYISLINSGTSVFAALVVFPMIGALGYRNYETCLTEMKTIFPTLGQQLVEETFDMYVTTNATDWDKISNNTPVVFRIGYGEMTDDEKKDLNWRRDKENIFYITSLDPSKSKIPSTNFNLTIRDCSIGKEATASGGGTGFVFVGFTEAVKHIPWSNLWSVLFFFMLFLLGIDSGFGTVEAAVAMIQDWTGFNRSKSTGLVCSVMMILAILLFPFGFGIYVVDLLDQFTATWTLPSTALVQCIIIGWFYGLANISYDVRLMTGSKPNLFILLCWKYITPGLLITLLIGSITQFVMEVTMKGGIFYKPFRPSKSTDGSGEVKEPLPSYSVATAFILMFMAMVWLPLHAVLRKTKWRLFSLEGPGDFPEEELRKERNINVAREEDQFTVTEKAIMGQQSLHNLQAYRDGAKVRSAARPALPEPGSEISLK